MSVRVIVVGAGDVARFVHLPALRRNPNASIVGIAARREAELHKRADEFSIDTYDTSWRHLLEATRPDLVVVATPNASHFEIAMGCLRNGAHVLLEKPAVVSRHEGSLLLQKAAACGLEIKVNMCLRLLPVVQRMRLLVEERLQPPGVGYELRYYISKPAQDWYQAPPSSGGGLMLTVGTHALDLISYVSGQPILRVDGGLNDGSADEARLVVSLQDGSRAIAFLGWNASGLSLSLLATSANGEARLTLGPGDTASLSLVAQSLLTESLWDKFVRYSSCNLFVDRILHGSLAQSMPDLVEHMQVLTPIFAMELESRWHT